MRNCIASLSIFLFLFSACVRTDDKEVVTYCKDSFVVIENQWIKVLFDTSSGEYSAIDKRDQSECISRAIFTINEFKSLDCKGFQWVSEEISDALGEGKKLVLKGEIENQAHLIFEITLYNTTEFIALNLGLENDTDKEIRITEFSPLQGRGYEGFAFPEYKTLDGENGNLLTQVRTEDTLRSRNNILITFGEKKARKRSMVLGGLSYNEFQKSASVIKDENGLELGLKAEDPHGKLIDAGSAYLFDDKFYVDFITDNRFENLEKYASSLSKANHVSIGGVDYPVLNFWYCTQAIYGNGPFRNNSTGVIEEMQIIADLGFLKYGPVALRLEPDDYAIPNNQQGWWDDEHWQKYKGGQLLEPFETIEKMGKELTRLGGIPFIYCQTARRSEDYCVKYPEHILFNNSHKLKSRGKMMEAYWVGGDNSEGKFWSYDFTDPGFIMHMEEVYENLRNGGFKGIKFDYPFTGWNYDGGFDDKYATTTSAYRNIFRLAKEGLGDNSDVQERIPPFGDVSIGVSTTQRTEGDNDRVYPSRVSKTGLRWYKNRMITNYDHDPVNPFHVYPDGTIDGWRAALTMTILTSGRLEIGKYFEDMTDSMRYTLSRVLPLLSAPVLSPRPVDAFSGKLYPEIYDFIINPSWHILTFYNHKIENQEWIKESKYYSWMAKNGVPQFQPDKMLPNQISVELGEMSDDGGLNLDPNQDYYVFDFWNWKFRGLYAGTLAIEQKLRAGEVRVMAIHKKETNPQFISTNRHILQGYLDMPEPPVWNETEGKLSGSSKLIADEAYKVIIAANGRELKTINSGNVSSEFRLIDIENQLYEVVFYSADNELLNWTMIFK